METLLQNNLPILEVAKDGIVSKMGDFTLAFHVEKPEVFSLGSDDYEMIHQAFVNALRVLPHGSVVHFQDWYTQQIWQPKADLPGSFLAHASDRFFKGRPYLEHKGYLFLTKRPKTRRASSSAFNTLTRRNLVPEELLNPDAIEQFIDHAAQFISILSDGGYLKFRQLKAQELSGTDTAAGLIEQYCSLNPDSTSPEIKDIILNKNVRIGDAHTLLYSLGDAAVMPPSCSNHTDYPRYSTDKTRFPVGFACSLGQLLSCDHICNQYIFIDDPHATLKRLETKRLRLQSLSQHDRGNAIARDAVNEFLNEAAAQQRTPVKVHINILAWTKEARQLQELRTRISSAIAQLGGIPHLETIGAPQIWWAAIPGNAGDFPMNETFDSFTEQASCFLQVESAARMSNSSSVIRFGDRQTGRPLEIDLFIEPLKRSIITSRGAFICGSSGGGKSMLCNHIFRSLYDQGAHIVIVDIGGSYKGLCDLVKGKYFTYSEDQPIRFNPFYQGKGQAFDTEKRESLKALLVTLWKQEHETFNRSEYVALSNAIQGYYRTLESNPDIFPCFNTFYEYLRHTYPDILREQQVKDTFFDFDNFLYVLRPFYKGGEFDYLLNAESNLDLTAEPFVVFELDNIKDHPILLPIVTLIITDLVMSKVRRLPSILKAFAIEEAWKAMMQAGMAEFIRYAWKTMRKLNGIPMVVTQEIDDLISSPIIKEAIIGNSDIKILMDMRKFVNKFDALQAVLGMSEKAKVQLFSLNRANEAGRKYREFYLELGGQVKKVLRYEPSPEEYYAYTTEASEKLMVQEYAARYGDMQKGIKALVNDMNK